MSIPVPLAVRLSTSRADRHVTADLRDLRFRSTAPGGFASCTMSFDRPLVVQPDEVGYYGRAYVYDTRNGQVVWEGRIEDPGRSNRPDGQVWDLVAMGPSAHAKDRTVPLIYVDRSLERWRSADKFTPGSREYVSDDPGGSNKQVLLMQFPQGLTLVTNSRAVLRYWGLYYSGQKMARYDWSWDAGVTSGSFEIQGVSRVDGGATGENSRTHTWNTAGGASSAKVVVTDFPNGRNTLDIRGIRTGAGTTIGSDDAWCTAIDPVVLALRYNADGTEKTTGYSANTVLSSEVVADLLGRLLVMYDGANASIATTSYAIEQLAYPDGVSAATVLDDLMKLDPAYYWAAWESNSAGKHRFEWSAWPTTTVRYEADVTDGYDAPGSAEGLFDAVRVRWRTNSGEVRTNRRTQTVTELTNAGFSREAIIDLGDDVGSSANADRAGDQFLSDHLTAPNAGRLRIARPIKDLVTGQIVMPWEIWPGNLIRVRGVLPRIGALNPNGRDSVTVFRAVSVEYSVSDAAAVVELDSYASSTVRALADLSNRANNRRR